MVAGRKSGLGAGMIALSVLTIGAGCGTGKLTKEQVMDFLTSITCFIYFTRE